MTSMLPNIDQLPLFRFVPAQHPSSEGGGISASSSVVTIVGVSAFEKNRADSGEPSGGFVMFDCMIPTVSQVTKLESA